MNRDALVAAVQSYAKRTNQLQTEIETLFIPNAESRIGRELRSMENEAFVEYVDQGTNDWAVPDDFAAVRELSYNYSGQRVTLYSETLASLSRYATSGVPNGYVITQRQIRVRPFQQRTYQLWYYSQPSLPDAASTNAVLDRWPAMYLQAVLTELYTWARNEKERQIALDYFGAEVAAINKAAKRARAAAPAGRRI